MHEDFWQARERLSALHQFAQARYVSPWGMLGAVLVRVVAAVPPQVRLPAITGGHASLNLYVGLVAAPGIGKGGAMSAAREAVDLPYVTEVGPGSGEGIGHLFVRNVVVDTKTKERELRPYRKKAIMYAPEVGTLNALSRRSASTLFPELNKAWFGEPLSWAYVREESKIELKPHSYRLCLVVGIQPNKADVILDDADSGTPQRLVWLPASDPEPVRGVREPAQLPDPLWKRRRSSAPGRDLPASGHLEHLKAAAERGEHDIHLSNDERRPHEIAVCESLREAVVEGRLAGLRGEVDPLDAHALMAREKVAAALMYLESREDLITEEDWQLAGVVMEISTNTRQQAVASLGRAKTVRNANQAEAEAHREVIKSDRMAEHGVQRAGRQIDNKLDGQWMPRAQLRRAVNSADRQYFDEAIDARLLAGTIEEREVRSAQRGTEYRKRR